MEERESPKRTVTVPRQLLVEDSGHKKEGEEAREGKGQRDIDGKREKEREGGRPMGQRETETDEGGRGVWLRDSGVHGPPSLPPGCSFLLYRMG